jgi:Lamin Tail Domain
MTKIVRTVFVLSSFVAACSSPSGGANDGGTKRVVINEVFPHGAVATDPDWIELKNVSSSPVDLTDYRLRDNKIADLTTLPTGTSIDAGGYLVVYCGGQNDGGAASGVYVPFKLSGSKGDEVHLSAPDGVEVDATSFGTDVSSDKSWGRLPDGTGTFVRTTPTKGTPNL